MAAGDPDSGLDTVAATVAADTEAPSGSTPSSPIAGVTLPLVEAKHYAFGREVARGGMGRILAAEDLRIGRPVAVKELLRRTPDLAARFEREARITARLQHPGIVPIYEIGAWRDGTPFYVMRMIAGQTLASTLKPLDTLAARLARLPSLIAACEAIAFAHSRGVIHRDLTPANIMVGEFGDTVVIDWGLAKELAVDVEEPTAVAAPAEEPPDSQLVTVAGTIVGTAQYMPPEQATAGQVDRRTDVYALGAILYFLLAGQPAYRGSLHEVLAKVTTGASPPALETVVPGAPTALVSIVTKAMAFEPDARYSSARELAEELLRFQTGRVVEAHSYSTGERVRRWVTAHRALVLAASTAVVAAAIAGSIGLVSVLHERDRANANAERAVEARGSADLITRDLLEEQGREQLLDGDEQRALAYFDAAMRAGSDSPELRFMIANALPNIEGLSRALPCNAIVRSYAFTGDGRELVAICGEQLVAWKIADGARLFTAPALTSVTALPSADGRVVLGLGTAATLFDGATGARRFALGDAPRTGYFAAGGDQVIVVHVDGVVRVWDTGTGKLVRSFQIPTTVDDDVRSAQPSGDGTRLVVATQSGHAEIWNPASGTRIATFEHGAHIGSAGLTKDGATAVTCGEDRVARVWNAATGRVVRVLAGHSQLVHTCQFDPSGERLMLTSSDGTVDVWDVATGEARGSLPHTGELQRASFSPDGRTIALSGGDGGLHLWDSDTGAALGHHDEVSARHLAIFSPDGALIAVPFAGEVRLWSTATRRRSALAPAEHATVLATSADASQVVVQDERGAWQVWATDSPRRIPHEPLRTVSPDPLELSSAASADNRRLVGWSPAGHLVVLDVATGATIDTIPLPAVPDDVETDGAADRILVRTDEHSRIWDVTAHRWLPALSDGFEYVTFTFDGRFALVADRAGTHEIREIATGRVVSTLAMPANAETHEFDATGTRLLIEEPLGDDALRFIVLDTQTGQPVIVLTGTDAILDQTRRLVVVVNTGRADVYRALDGRLQSTAQLWSPTLATHFAVPTVSGDGAFLAVIDDASQSLIVASARDGRQLGRFDRVRYGGTLGAGTTLDQVQMVPYWVPGTHQLVALLGHSAVWTLEPETRSLAALHEIIERRCSWRVVNGKLVAKLGSLGGTIAPAPGGRAPASVVVRHEPDGVPMTVSVDAAGHYEVTKLAFGIYRVTAGDRPPVEASVTTETRIQLDIAP